MRILADKLPGLTNKIRISPDEGKSYFDVLVFDTLASMRRYAKSKIMSEPGRIKPGRKGIGLFYAIFFPERGPHNLGELLYSRTKLNRGTVAHEIGHAAMHWSRVEGLDASGCCATNDANDDDEETFITALDDMVEQFYEEIGI